MQESLVTSFVDLHGNLLGDTLGVISIPLYKGMQITIHSNPKSFTVVDWSYHQGHPDERAGLKVVLE